MQASAVNLEIMEFVEKNILPRYTKFDKAHGLTHVRHVINNSLTLAETCGVDPNMVYVVAAYHDLGLSGPRAVHHLTSGKILVADLRLRKWFSPEQLNIMKEAVEDHRASASHTPRSIYGKIVAEADRELEPEIVIQRTVDYGINHYPEKSKEEQWERFVTHIENKYSAHGYIRLWLPNSPNHEKISYLRSLISNRKLLRDAFEKAYEKSINEPNEPK